MLDPKNPESVGFQQMVELERLLVEALAHYSSAVLLDLVSGAAQSINSDALPGHAGLLVSLEATGDTDWPGQRLSRLEPGWAEAKIQRPGASAVKLLVYPLDDPECQVARRFSRRQPAGSG